MSLNLKIVSPERVEYDGAADQVLVPGSVGQFEILPNHAPIISTLDRGTLAFRNSEGLHELNISMGVVEVQKNIVNICVEL